MTDVYYRTGAAAKRLGLSTYELRRLAESSLIEAEYNGNQWRFPVTEVERLLKVGVPPIPAASNPQDGEQPAQRSKVGASGAGGGLLGPPSEDLIAATEEVVLLENEVKSLGLRKQKEQGLDWFRGRERDQAEELATEEREDRARLAEDEARRERDEWLRTWEAHALSLIPWGAPPDLPLEVQRAVRARLLSLNPTPAPPVARQLTEALVARLLAPWRRQQAIQDALVEARDTLLPVAARGSGGQLSKWQSRAIRAAAEAVKPLWDYAPLVEIQAAVKQAVSQVAAEFAHEQACQKMVAGVSLPGTTEEDEQARAAVKEALAVLPIGASEKQMQAARDAATQPIREAIARRQAEAEAERQRIQAEVQAAEGRKWAMVLASQERADHHACKRDILTTLHWSLPWDSGAALTPEATAAVAKALDQLPVPASWDELTRARDLALEPHIAAYKQRQRKEAVIAGGLRQIGPYIAVLEKKWRFIGKSAAALEAELGQPVRTALERHLSGGETPEEVGKRVRQLVRNELDIAPSRAA